MRAQEPPPASSGWEWNASTPVAPQGPPPPRPRGGSAEAVLAVVVFLGLAAAGVVGYFVWSSDDDAASVATAQTAEGAPTPDDAKPDAEAAAQKAAEAHKAAAAKPSKTFVAPSLDPITWTVQAPETLKDLSRTWSIPRDVLTKLNPKLSTRKPIEAGTAVIVHRNSLGASASIGPPNDGRLSRGVPLPEGEGWAMPDDRTRAFGTNETIASIAAALHAYRQQFPDADPIQVGDLSARRGGKIFGHQSHQSGVDVDIRLVRDATGEGFDATRTWFLVKTFIDNNDVRAIFLNNTEQVWLRAEAESDVGASKAETYFALIRHEPGHTIHMHVRFACPDKDKRCVGYSLPDTGEEDVPKGKLPLKPGATVSGGSSKLPKGGLTPAKKKKKKKGTKKKGLKKKPKAG